MKSLNVFYDPQQNSYFKIDKQTGQAQKSHRNGSDFVKFKPDYTGADYRIRRSNQKDLSPGYLSKPVFQINYPHKHTVPIDQNSIKRQAKSQVAISAAPIYDLKSSLIGYESRLLQSRTIPHDELHEKLKQYNRIKEDLKRQNHSPRKGYEGSIESSSNLKLQFKNELIKGLTQSSLKKRKNPAPILKTSQTTSRLGIKDQVLKEREIFFRFNDHLRPQENQRQEKELRERKTNLKILENLFIAKNNRQTSIVYQ